MRFRARFGEDGPELFCAGCRTWLPFSAEYWSRDLWRCRTCLREYARLRQARLLVDPEGRMKNVTKSRRYRDYLRDQGLLDAQAATQREYKRRSAIEYRLRRVK